MKKKTENRANDLTDKLGNKYKTKPSNRSLQALPPVLWTDQIEGNEKKKHESFESRTAF